MLLIPHHAGQWLVIQPIHLSSFPCQEESPGKPTVGSRRTTPPVKMHLVKSLGASKRLAYAPILSSSSFITEGHNPSFQCVSLRFERCASWGLPTIGTKNLSLCLTAMTSCLSLAPTQCSWNTYLLVIVDICHHWVTSVFPFLSVTPVGPPA